MAKEKNLELTVGGFVIIAFVCLAIFILSVGDVAIFEQGNPMKIVFNFASGIKKAAPVRIAGVESGIVKDISLFFDEGTHQTKVAIHILIDRQAKIPVDSTVMINSSYCFERLNRPRNTCACASSAVLTGSR